MSENIFPMVWLTAIVYVSMYTVVGSLTIAAIYSAIVLSGVSLSLAGSSAKDTAAI